MKVRIIFSMGEMKLLTEEDELWKYYGDVSFDSRSKIIYDIPDELYKNWKETSEKFERLRKEILNIMNIYY